jgi:hypothetical protein
MRHGDRGWATQHLREHPALAPADAHPDKALRVSARGFENRRRSGPLREGNVRSCDICHCSIPPGAVYRAVRLAPEGAAALLAAGHPDLVPSWTQEEDGTVALDICRDCALAMGSSAAERIRH